MLSNVNHHENLQYLAILDNPFRRKRFKTDVSFVYIFGFVVIITLSISIYVYAVRDDPSDFYKLDHYFIENSNFTHAIVFEKFDALLNDYGFNRYAAPSILVAIYYLYFFAFFLAIFYWNPKTLIYLTIFMFYFCIIVLIPFLGFLIIALISSKVDDEILRNFGIGDTFDLVGKYVITALNLILLISTVICFHSLNEGVKTISQIFKKSCRSLICFRSVSYLFASILFYLVTVILELLLILFVRFVYFEEKHSKLLLCIWILGLFYIYSVLYCFGVAVMSNTIASWHYSQENDENTSNTISVLKSVGIIIRHHIGTVAFAATIFIPFGLAIFFAFKQTIVRCRNRTIARIFQCILIGNITNFALIQNTVHGYNFRESTRRTFDLMVQNYSISLVVIKVFEFIMYFIVNLPITVSMLLLATSDYYEKKITLSLVYDYHTLIQILALPVFMIIGTAVNTTLVCRLEKQELEKRTEITFSYNGTQRAFI